MFPVGADKKPLTLHGFHSATTAAETITNWWARWPNAGIGWAIPPRGLVLDVDARHRGHESLDELEGQHGKLPRTTASITGGGGLHLLFRTPGDVECRQTAGEIGAGLDTRTGGKGYVILPPSAHASGLRYTWRDRVPPALAPGWLLDLVRVPVAAARTAYSPPELPSEGPRRCRYAWRALEGECDAVARTGEGGRNHRLCAAWLRCTRDLGDVLPRDVVRDHLTRAALAAGLPEPEIRRVLRDDLAIRGAA